MDGIIAAIITGVVTLVGVVLTNTKTQAVIEERIKHVQDDIQRLEKEQQKHNSVIERTYKLEERVSIIEAKIEKE